MNWRKFLRFHIIGLLGVSFLAASGARSGELTAIVEDLSDGIGDIGLFDYLSPGAVIDLAAGEWIKLCYLQSCIQETVTGGTVSIGEEKSAVTGGTVERQTVECDGGNLQLTSDQSDRAGVAVMRKSPGGSEVELTVHGLSPLFRFTGETQEFELERLDRPQETLLLETEEDGIDLAELGIALKKGGLYRARAGMREITFRVDKFARPGEVPVLSRLIPL